MAISEYLGVINAIIFTIAFVLFLVVKLKDNLTKGTIYSYFAFTFIFAVSSIYSIFTKMTSDSSGFKATFYSYFGGFLVNAILGMIIMHGFNIKLFYAFFSIFVTSILGVLYILTNTSENVNPEKSDTWFNVSGWDDFLNKSKDMFNYKWEWDECKNPISTIIFIIKAIITSPFWVLYAAFSGLSALFGMIPISKQASSQSSWINENFPIYFQKSVSYTFVLLLFLMGLIIMVSSQKAMRKQPLNVLAVAFVAAFAYLGYVRFFQSESFTNQFMVTLFVLFMLGIYLYNPNNILKNITGVNFTIILFICLFLIGMIFIYNYFTVDAGDMATKWKDIFSKMAYAMIGLSISISIIVWMVTAIANSQGKTTPGMYILNALIVIGMLTIVYTSLDVNKLFKDNLYAKLIVNLILYIPCLLSDLADMVMSEYYKMNYFTLIVVILEIIFIIAYWVIYPDMVSKIYSDEGKVIINESTSLASSKTVGYYRNLSGSTLLDNKNNQVVEQKSSSTSSNKYGAFDGDTTVNAVSGKPLLDASGNPIKDDHGNYFMPTRVNTYRYCMSFWLYINPMPSYGDKFVSLLNYGNNPNVMYNPSKNDFSIFMKSPDPDCTTTTTIPIYTNMDIPLQKWFNVVLNYDSGMLDVFLNAELVKTSFDVISCIQYDALTIGEDSGANAKICNLTYFRSPVDIVTIRRMYNVAKIQDTPIVPKKDLFSI